MKSKKIFFLFVSILTLIACGRFFKKKESPTTPTVINECDPKNYKKDESATKFIPPTSSTVLIRKNFNFLTTAEQQNFAYGIKQMMTLSETDPTSYAFQARIHNGPIATLAEDLGKPFKTCQHADCCFFLAWHRMYIYFFERILQSKMLAANRPALPYWDFQDFVISPVPPATIPISGSIPWQFRYPATPGNALYDANRAPDFNKYPDGFTFVTSVSTNAFDDAINNTGASTAYNYNYFNFQNDVYNAHGDIHTSVGMWTELGSAKIGDLGVLETAANDPLFFILHANVDRMWEKWLNTNSRNFNPSSKCNKYWMNRQFVFYDELGNKVYLRGLDIINSTVSKLNYKYDDVVVPLLKYKKCKKSSKQCPEFPKASIFKETTNTKVNDRYVKVSSDNFYQSADLKTFLVANPAAPFLISNTDETADNIFIEIEDVQIINPPNGIIEIYASKNNEVMDSLKTNSKLYAGNINLFALQNSGMHKTTQNINITELIKKQNFKFSDLNSLNLFFVARGNSLSGIEKPTTVKLNIGKLRIAVYKSNKIN